VAAGINVTWRIRLVNSSARIIGLTLYELDAIGLEALAAGATAIIAIDQIAESLVELIRTAS
jgi:DNA-binding NarL/FixJ family response regulator